MQRAEVEKFYRAFGERDVETFVKYIDENVVWRIAGPVDIMKFCGTYRGREAVIDAMVRKIPETMCTRRIIADKLLVDGNRGAALGRLTAKTHSGQSISYRVAQFFEFRDGKVVNYDSVIDSFDAVEQLTGRRIDVSAGKASAAPEGELFAV